MKTIYYAATVLAAFGLLAVTSCHKDAPVDPKIEFSANLPELTVGSMGGTLTIEFTSAAAWTAAPGATTRTCSCCATTTFRWTLTSASF